MQPAPPAPRASCPTHGAPPTGQLRGRRGSAPPGCRPRWQPPPAVAAGMGWADCHASRAAGQVEQQEAVAECTAQARTRSLRTRHVVAVQPLVRSSSGALAAGQQAEPEHEASLGGAQARATPPPASASAHCTSGSHPSLPHPNSRLPQTRTVHPCQQVFVGVPERIREHGREGDGACQACGMQRQTTAVSSAQRCCPQTPPSTPGAAAAARQPPQ